MRKYQFWFIIAGLLQIHYDLNKSTMTLVVLWIVVIIGVYEAWRDKEV